MIPGHHQFPEPFLLCCTALQRGCVRYSHDPATPHPQRWEWERQEPLDNRKEPQSMWSREISALWPCMTTSPNPPGYKWSSWQKPCVVFLAAVCQWYETSPGDWYGIQGEFPGLNAHPSLPGECLFFCWTSLSNSTTLWVKQIDFLANAEWETPPVTVHEQVHTLGHHSHPFTNDVLDR